MIDARLVAEIQIDAAPLVGLFHAIFDKYGSETADGIIAGLVYYKAQLDADGESKH